MTRVTEEMIERLCAVVDNYGLDKPRLRAALEAVEAEMSADISERLGRIESALMSLCNRVGARP